jgi:hypothetical protein
LTPIRLSKDLLAFKNTVFPLSNIRTLQYRKFVEVAGLPLIKKTLKRMQDIDKLDDNTRDKLFFLIDNVVQNSKAKRAFAS